MATAGTGGSGAMLGLAGGLAALGALSAVSQINAQNKALAAQWEATNSALSFTQASNWINAAQAVDDIKRVNAYNLRQAGVAEQQGLGKVSMNEGITAGNSKARVVQNYILQGNEQLGQMQAQGESTITKLAFGVENQNYAIQQQKIQAYNNMKASMITGNAAALQIATGALGMGIQGTSLGMAVDKYQASTEALQGASNAYTYDSTQSFNYDKQIGGDFTGLNYNPNFE